MLIIRYESSSKSLERVDAVENAALNCDASEGKFSATSPEERDGHAGSWHTRLLLSVTIVCIQI